MLRARPRALGAVVAHVGDVLPQRVVPEDHVLRVEVAALLLRPRGDDRGMRQLPMDAVARRPDAHPRALRPETADHAKPLIGGRIRIQEHHPAVLAEDHAIGPVPEHDVVLAAARVFDQPDLGLRPADAVLRGGVADGAVGVPRVPLRRIHGVVPHVVGGAVKERAAVRPDPAFLPRPLGLDRHLAALARRVHDDLHALGVGQKGPVNEHLPPVADLRSGRRRRPLQETQ